MADPLLPTTRELAAAPGRGPHPVRRPPLRIWVWTAGTLVVAAGAVRLWPASDAAAPSSTTTSAASAPTGAPAAEVSAAWTSATTPSSPGVMEGGRGLVT